MQASGPASEKTHTERRRCVFYLRSRHHGSNCQLKALAEELALGGGLAVPCDTDVRSRKRMFRPLFQLALWIAKKIQHYESLQRALVRMALKGDCPKLAEGDIIVAKTEPFELPLALLGVQQGVVTCFVGQLKRVSRSYIDRILSTPSSPAENPDGILSVLPSSVKYADFCNIQKDMPSRDQRERVWCLLIGGAANGFEYGKQHWEKLGQLVVDAARSFSVKWLISTSPRSGDIVEAIFQEIYEETEAIQTLIIWSDPASRGQLSIMQMAAFSEVVFVTEDSAGMLSDMAITRLPLVALRPEHESYNVLSTPVALSLQSRKCLFRSVLGEFDQAAFRFWLGEEFEPLPKCWTEELKEFAM